MGSIAYESDGNESENKDGLRCVVSRCSPPNGELLRFLVCELDPLHLAQTEPPTH